MRAVDLSGPLYECAARFETWKRTRGSVAEFRELVSGLRAISTHAVMLWDDAEQRVVPASEFFQEPK